MKEPKSSRSSCGPASVVTGVLLFVVGACVAGWLSFSGASAATPEAADRLFAACADAMLRSSCRVMNGPQASRSADVVFVAGVGPIDAKAYRELRANGEAMCQTVRKACRQDWDGSQCKTARSLWPTVAPTTQR